MSRPEQRRSEQRRPEHGSILQASTDRTAVELLDRTGIVAASLPRRRRPVDERPEPEPIFTRPPVCDQDLRPKSVVIRRRARAWLGSGAAAALIGLGWLGGSLSGSAPADEVAQVDPHPAVVAEPQPQPWSVPQQVQPAPQVPPVTVYVPVPVRPATPKHAQAQAKPQPKQASSEDVPRVDLPTSSTPITKVTTIPAEVLMQPWVDAAESMARSYNARNK
jgi:hypothetical protein